MDRMIYLSMAGAKATMQRQDALAHNLANASTPGFRAEMTAFRAVPVLGQGASTRVYALESTPGYNAEAGTAQPTGRNLDVAMQGNAWLAVQGLDGTEAYTRAGSLDVDADGLLVTKTGLTVLGDGGPITLPQNAQLQIAPDGTITAAAVGQGKAQAVGKLKLVTPEAPLQRGEDGLFRAADGDLPADPNARLQDGALEGSNVSAVETMIAMIAAARQFEQQMKMVHTAQDKEQSAAKLLSNS
ncbi:MAG TPA: flagellar basal-body rod protein FlgF [Burkholderiaceae bacterium]|nr:flagellar basal-body rod protein FlgF [Burkholderiaceae bacterium]